MKVSSEGLGRAVKGVGSSCEGGSSCGSSRCLEVGHQGPHKEMLAARYSQELRPASSSSSGVSLCPSLHTHRATVMCPIQTAA